MYNPSDAPIPTPVLYSCHVTLLMTVGPETERHAIISTIFVPVCEKVIFELPVFHAISVFGIIFDEYVVPVKIFLVLALAVPAVVTNAYAHEREQLDNVVADILYIYIYQFINLAITAEP
jgi:hypothetical protein